jgi:malate dehydrogenase (oxaloacetate-decarboxylating)(NADP+)
VISNGTAVLGLGNIGALAGKPVMEGKAVLFKRFAGIDVFDIEVNTQDPDEFINIVQKLEPTFGGINLEDIKAPDCFYIEETLRKTMSIPIFHDDQHGTAIISAAGLFNAAKITGRRFEELRIVINGAGAAAISCAKLYVELGLPKQNIIMSDSKGVIYAGRKQGMNPYKELFATDDKARTLAEAAKGADVLIGLSVANAFTPEMLLSMSAKPIIFALANPNPEIDYALAKQTVPDSIVATGRSDFPNQVNNVLGFPFIFRGALDVRASTINEPMKIAAVKAIAEIAQKDVPDSVIHAYGGRPIIFGPDYIIPKPLDSRVLLSVAPAVAQAAIDSGVAQKAHSNKNHYIAQLEATLGPEREILRHIISRAQANPKRIVLPEGHQPVILRAANALVSQGIAHPVVLGNPDRINALAKDLHISLAGIEVLDHWNSPDFVELTEKLYLKRARKGWTKSECKRKLRSPYLYGAMMVEQGIVDGQVHGVVPYYPEAIRPVLQVIPRQKGVSKVSGVYLMVFKEKTFFFADTTVNIHPTAEDLAEIAILTAQMAEFFKIPPRIAMLSFSNFGSTRHPDALKVEKAVQIVRDRRPDLVIDGEMQGDTAVTNDLLCETYPFNRLCSPANVLIFPELSSGNIAYNLLDRLGGATAIGPLLMGISRPFNVLQTGADMENIVNVSAITVVQAQESE